MKKIIHTFFFLGGMVGLAGCYDCGPRAEPTISLSVSRSETPTSSLQSVSAIGVKSDSLFRQFSIKGSSGSGQLPLSLLQDSTTYLFYFADRVDTLTLFYKRIFDTCSECGYYLDIAEPDGPHFHSTFSNTTATYYPYTGKVEGLNGSGAYGILVDATSYN